MTLLLDRALTLLGITSLSLALFACAASQPPAVKPERQIEECVVLFHGLLRSAASMDKLERAFLEAGYAVANVDHPSRHHAIPELSEIAVSTALETCPDGYPMHFVTHSLGGILVRYYLAHFELPQLGRVVMMAPPNGGSEIVDYLGWLPGFRLLNGPAGMQLGTRGENSIPAQLGPVDYELGIIAGTKTLNPLLSQYLPNPDDGKVSLASTKVAGMKDFIALPHSHVYLMRSEAGIRQALQFLQHGRFDPLIEPVAGQ